MSKKNIIVYTIGHSTRTFEAFLEILKHYHITRIIDIRTVPRSRHNPQFEQEKLRESLENAHIHYKRIKLLGGFRHARSDSVNTAWQNTSFRGFADYMQTEEFKKGLSELIDYAKKEPVAIMCAEAVPWRCHRSLIGDALSVRGIDVEDIFSLTSCKPHTLTPWAHVEGETITYP